jgi:hypothetical protein
VAWRYQGIKHARHTGKPGAGTHGLATGQQENPGKDPAVPRKTAAMKGKADGGFYPLAVNSSTVAMVIRHIIDQLGHVSS